MNKIKNVKTFIEENPNQNINSLFAHFKTDCFLSLQTDKPFHDIWFFENEPVNINRLRSHLPNIRVVFFDSTHSRAESAPNDIPSIIHFMTDIS